MAFGKRKTEEQKAPKVTVETPSTELEKFKMLFALGKSLDKKFDTTNSLLRLGSKNVVPIPVISTELPTFDFGALECGGIPRGRIVEVFGPASAGKTSISLHVVAQEQTQGGIAAVVDIEHALDPQYAQQLGVDIDKLIISQPDSGEQALQIVEELIDSKCVSLIVVDSVAALVPEAELAGEMSDQNVGLQARLMSRACRKLTAKCATNNVTLLFINQIRMSIGVMYGNPEVVTGGKALGFYASVRVDVRRKEAITLGNKENIIGHQVQLKCVKNKCGRPFRAAVVDLIYPGTERPAGFDKISSLIEYASRRGLFEMSGSWFSFNGEKLANGLANLKETLRDRDDVIKTLRTKIATLEKDDGLPEVTMESI
jgi:recombination protein RecA